MFHNNHITTHITAQRSCSHRPSQNQNTSTCAQSSVTCGRKAPTKQNRRDKKKKNMIDSCGQPISDAILGSNTINTNVSSNQRAAGGGDEFHCPHCVYFRQYIQRKQSQAETNTTKETLKVCLSILQKPTAVLYHAADLIFYSCRDKMRGTD